MCVFFNGDFFFSAFWWSMVVSLLVSVVWFDVFFNLSKGAFDGLLSHIQRLASMTFHCQAYLSPVVSW